MAIYEAAVSARDIVRDKFDQDTGISSLGAGVVRVGEGYGILIYVPNESSTGLLPTKILDFPIEYSYFTERGELTSGMPSEWRRESLARRKGREE